MMITTGENIISRLLSPDPEIVFPEFSLKV